MKHKGLVVGLFVLALFLVGPPRELALIWTMILVSSDLTISWRRAT